MVKRADFPSDFRWGVATSAAQIEGAATADRRSPSIWDRFAALPGRIEDGSDPGVACGHFERWREDVALLDWLGVGSYRFSIAWPRILPEGRGHIEEAGLDFYDRLVDALLSRGIDPVVTLYHWDLPQCLEDVGGWAARDTAEGFAELAAVCGGRLGDRVRTFVTHNEPWCAAMLGHREGVHAPGHRDLALALSAGHHMLLSHGWAVQALRAEAPEAETGIVQLVSPGHPASSSEADRRATARFDAEINRWFIEPPALGRYPQDLLARYLEDGVLTSDHPVLANHHDLDVISTPTDFLGLNYYSRAVIRADVPESQNAAREVWRREEDVTDMDWEVYPAGLREVLVRASREWNAQKLYVTENGAAYGDGPDESGAIRDERRVRYLSSHIEAMRDALGEGAPVAGYFVWSLLDNFEWAFGYAKRFGIFWVDFETLERRPKQSAHWYRSFLAES